MNSEKDHKKAIWLIQDGTPHKKFMTFKIKNQEHCIKSV